MPMPSPAMIAKMILLVAGLHVSGYNQGPAAYYNEINLRGVCEWRVSQGWQPGLDCDWPCLATWGKYEPEMLGVYVLADLPGSGFRVCEIVDVRQKIHEAENGHIVIEIDGETAREAGWQTYVPNVRVWRLEKWQE